MIEHLLDARHYAKSQERLQEKSDSLVHKGSLGGREAAAHPYLNGPCQPPEGGTACALLIEELIPGIRSNKQPGMGC